ncbi:hypothetical protein [Roseomonas sp. WA12]
MDSLAHTDRPETLALPCAAPRDEFASPAAPARMAVLPSAVVAVPVPPGMLETLRPVLVSLAQSRTAGNLPVAAGALAVLILAVDAEALALAEAIAPDLPFPLRVEAGPGDTVLAMRHAATWARELGTETVPILIAERGRPVAPRWAYDLLSAIRDGADIITPRAPLWAGLLGPAPPIALSGRAQWAMERWSAGNLVRRGAAWSEPDSPWRHLARSGLRTIPA